MITLSLLYALLDATVINRLNVGSAIGVFLLQAIIPSYILYLLLSKKGSMVFSSEYRRIIERTPHIQYRTSWIVKGCMIVMVGVFMLAFVAAFIGSRR